MTDLTKHLLLSAAAGLAVSLVALLFGSERGLAEGAIYATGGVNLFVLCVRVSREAFND